MDSELIPGGVKRCSTRTFFLWTLPWIALLTWGLVSAFLCLWKGLNQTNMSDYFAFALWIVFDLSVIALGAGAFFTGFLTYIIGLKELKNIINATVIIGFICYSGAVAMLGIDIGQPIRGWFIFSFFPVIFFLFWIPDTLCSAGRAAEYIAPGFTGDLFVQSADIFFGA